MVSEYEYSMVFHEGKSKIKYKIQSFHWTNGDIYIGDWRDGVPHGHGEFQYGVEGLKKD